LTPFPETGAAPFPGAAAAAPLAGTAAPLPGSGIVRLAEPGAILAGGAVTGRVGADGFAAFGAGRAGALAAGLRARGFACASFFRPEAAFVFFFAAVGIGFRLSSKERRDG
jgi:hypothetical protein